MGSRIIHTFQKVSKEADREMRRTKEAAARTRAEIVAAALDCFDRHGMAGSTLDQIADSAHVTKGAIYHHFSGKRALVRAIRDQVSLPLVDEADTALLHASERPALKRIERYMVRLLEGLEKNVQLRRALSVMQFKCEYVADLADDLAGAVRSTYRLTRAFEAAYREARREGTLAQAIAPRAAAVESVMFLSGLVRIWLLDSRRAGFRREARAAIRAHVRLRYA
jgi:TetR/AcrR family transcriptional regulator, acrAB operon repressor